MYELAEWESPSLVRTALAVIVAVLLVATCIKWLRLRSPDGEQWAWLLLIVQGAMFASLTIRPPTDWLPKPPPRVESQVVPAMNTPVPTDAAPRVSRPTPKAVPLRLDMPERQLDRRSKPIEVFIDLPRRHSHGQLACLP
jgi:hypothetical protein